MDLCDFLLLFVLEMIDKERNILENPSYEKIEITSEVCENLLKQEIFTISFNAGGWIAGGFAREIFLSIRSPEKSRFKDIYDYIKVGRGDVDIFFPNKESLEDLLSTAVRHKLMYTKTKFTTSAFLGIQKDVSVHLKVQLVDTFFYRDTFEAFENFDFANSCYAIVKEDSKFYVIGMKYAIQADAAGVLHVKKSNSPYTIQRMYKYLSKRGLHKISNESKDVVYDLLIRSASHAFDKKYEIGNTLYYFNKCIKFLFESELIQVKYVVLFLGKFKKIIAPKYGPTITFDWASDMLKNHF